MPPITFFLFRIRDGGGCPHASHLKSQKPSLCTSLKGIGGPSFAMSLQHWINSHQAPDNLCVPSSHYSNHVLRFTVLINPPTIGEGERSSICQWGKNECISNCSFHSVSVTQVFFILFLNPSMPPSPTHIISMRSLVTCIITPYLYYPAHLSINPFTSSLYDLYIYFI